MSKAALRAATIRLAQENEALRPHLLPLVTKQAGIPNSVSDMNRALSKESLPDGEELLSTFQDAGGWSVVVT